MKTSSVIRIPGQYIFAVLVCYALASSFSTQSVIASLDSLGITVNWGDRLRMGLHDLAGMTGVFLPVIAAAFAIALPLVAWLSRRQSGWRTLLFTLAGAVALIAVHLSLEVTFDIIPIAGARSPLGLCAQGLAGAVGGYCFGALRQGTPR